MKIPFILSKTIEQMPQKEVLIQSFSFLDEKPLKIKETANYFVFIKVIVKKNKKLFFSCELRPSSLCFLLLGSEQIEKFWLD